MEGRREGKKEGRKEGGKEGRGMEGRSVREQKAQGWMVGWISKSLGYKKMEGKVGRQEEKKLKQRKKE